MSLPEEYKKYLHYDTHPRRIFDLEKNQYEPLVKVLSWKRRGRSIHFQCQTAGERTATVEIMLCSPKIFRLRMTAVTPFPDTETFMVVKKDWPPVNFSLEEDEETMHIKTAALTIAVRKNPCQLQVFDPSGQTVFSQHIYGHHRVFYPVFPLGFLQTEDGKTFVYESVDLAPDEHIFGLGEKFSALDKRGQRVTCWQTDTTLTTTDRSYKNIPFFMTTAGYGIFINTSYRIHYEMGSESFVSYSFLIEDSKLEYYFIFGPSFKEIIFDYTEITGKSPLPPKWAFGLWMSRAEYKSRAEVEQVCTELRRRKIPCDVVHLDPAWMHRGRYCDFEWDTQAFPQPEEMLAGLRRQGFRVSMWEQPYVKVGTEMFREGEERGFFVKTKEGKTYLQWDFEKKPSAMVDFTNPQAREWYQNKHRKLLAQGASVFKTDMGEAIPEDAVCYNGKTGAEMHNLYPLLYNATVYEASRDYCAANALVWGRSGYAGSQRYPVTWSGDSHSTFADMACVLRAGLSYGLSGVPFWGHDIGGFQGPAPSPELYIRWAQFGLLCSHSRCHGINPREPWAFGEEAVRIFRKYVRLRYQLLPYIFSYAREATQSGLPLVRPLVLDYQDDPNTFARDLEYLLGRDLLVAPILNPEGRVDLYLPEGEWTDWWTGKKLMGPRNIRKVVPLEVLPIYVRENAVIPLAPVMNFVDEKPMDPVTLQVFMSSAVRFELFDYEKVVTLKGSWAKGTILFEVGPWHKQLEIVFHDTDAPKEVRRNGKRRPQVVKPPRAEAWSECWWCERGKRRTHVRTMAEGEALSIQVKF